MDSRFWGETVNGPGEQFFQFRFLPSVAQWPMGRLVERRRVPVERGAFPMIPPL